MPSFPSSSRCTPCSVAPPHPPHVSPPILAGLAGPRPCGLEEDVRQYEQDLAKRLYQARVRASQGTADPQPPTSSSSSSSSAAAASQLRSAPRPPPTWARGTASWGCAQGALVFGGILLGAGKVQASTGSSTVLPLPFLCCLASARLCPPTSPVCVASSLQHCFHLRLAVLLIFTLLFVLTNMSEGKKLTSSRRSFSWNASPLLFFLFCVTKLNR